MENTRNNELPLIVTIRCLVYNHEPFLRQCLDGFVMQKTCFRFEAIVHDDASTDGSAAIIREYAEKYPEIIKPIFETENQYSKNDGSIRRIMNAHTHGKYVAMCEGDDYWTDPYKLQKQVDFLESHPDYSICLHKYLIQNLYTGCFEEIARPFVVKDSGFSFDLKYYISGEWVTRTLTAVLRTSVLQTICNQYYKNFKDVVLFYELLKYGKGFILPDICGVYRVHPGGVWSGADLNRQCGQDFEAGLSIYSIEKTKEAARFLLYQFTKPISRKWLFKNYRMTIEVVTILVRNFGFIYVSNILFKKFILNKLIQLED